ncbi:hypothetical protein E2542_SST04875 [Spatholobus suberectus]|nr:hypothetical protein E2542_SST04875 [Spatholobus suberectus]
MEWHQVRRNKGKQGNVAKKARMEGKLKVKVAPHTLGMKYNLGAKRLACPTSDSSKTAHQLQASAFFSGAPDTQHRYVAHKEGPSREVQGTLPQGLGDGASVMVNSSGNVRCVPCVWRGATL